MYSDDKLDKIYRKTDGACHLCGKALIFSNYGNNVGQRGKWEVEHSVPMAMGGTDHLNNLYPSCISCNRSKGKQTTRLIRNQNGRTRAPYSAEKKSNIRQDNTIGGGIIGLALTTLCAMTPIGIIAGTITCATIGYSLDPEE